MPERKEEIEKIERYINGLSDKNERNYIESLFSNGENNGSLRHIIQKDWDNVVRNESVSNTDLSHLLDKVHHIIRKNETLRKKKPLQRLMSIYMKAAAILLLPLLIAGGLVFSFLGKDGVPAIENEVKSTIYAPMGSRVSFNLPDGTSGMLNSGSSLTYSLPFAKNRQISLEGEAWFRVISDKKNPFEINTGNSFVKVLGTSFNLSAYPSENYVEVVLQNGEVEFTNKENNEKVTLNPSERLILQDGKINKSVTDPTKYNAWIEGKLVFRGDPMVEVARRIERWYNVDVVLADKELENYSFRATFEDDKLINVLQLLSLTSPIKYQMSTPKLLADGTYEKVKITFYMKD